LFRLIRARRAGQVLMLTWFIAEQALEADEQIAEGEPAYSPDGVDLTLIRWMLSLTPAERLAAVQGFADSAWEIRARNCKA
jgi:hypothetical protein